MAFRIIRQRKEARRLTKLEEIFEERDKTGSGAISAEQLEDIYRIYQAELDPGRAGRITDQAGQITREDFIQFAKETHLLATPTAMGDAMLLLSPRKNKKSSSATSKKVATKQQVRLSEESTTENSCSPMLACFCSDRRVEADELGQPDQFNKVEAAFRKFDVDKDGFLSWEEFQQLAKDLDQEQALRIFHTCNQSGTGLISLEEFKAMVNRKQKLPVQTSQELPYSPVPK